MARLAGKFAGVLRVDAPIENIQPLTDALNKLRAQGLTVVVESTDDQAADAEARVLNLHLIRPRPPGASSAISPVHSSSAASTSSTSTPKSSRAPMTGEPLFQADAILHANPDTPLDDLRDSLDRIANELDLDLHLEEAD